MNATGSPGTHPAAASRSTPLIACGTYSLIRIISASVRNRCVARTEPSQTADRVDEDIIDRDGYNYTRAAGLTSPFSFNEIIRRSFDNDILDMRYTVESTTSELSCATFLKAYADVKRTVEVTIFYPERNIYNRLTYILKQDAQTGHIMGYVVCRDVTEAEVYRLAHAESAQRALEETDNIIASAGVGIWKIVLFDGEKTRMYANRVMQELREFANHVNQPPADRPGTVILYVGISGFAGFARFTWIQANL